MRQATPDTTRNARGTRGIAILATLFLAGLCFAAPAQAGGNEFDDGFQDQLGRLVASEVFHLGKRVIASGHGYAHVDYAPRRYDRDDHHARHRGHGYGHYKKARRHERRHDRHHYRHHDRHRPERRHYWRRHHAHDHGYGATCRVEYEHHGRRGDRYARH